jgi:hypothetical protein
MKCAYMPSKMPARARSVLLGLGAALAFPALSQAQDLDAYFPIAVPGYDRQNGVTVLSRLRPLYEPYGIRAGDFIIHPRLDEAFGYDSNVMGTSPGEGSLVLRTSPSVSARSDWSRDSLGASLSVDDYRYLEQSRQSYTNVVTAVGGGYTIGRDNLVAAYSHLSLNQPAWEVGAIPSDRPVHYEVNDLRAEYDAILGRITLTPNVDVRSFAFDNTTILGVPSNQQYRNRVVVSGGATARYAMGDERALLFILQGGHSIYTDTPRGEPTPNSRSVLAVGGFDYDAGGPWRYRLLFGLEVRDFASPQFATRAAPIAEGTVVWTPSGLTTVTGTLTRRIEDPAAEGTSGFTYTSARLIVDHEYLRNVLLQGRAKIQAAQYQQGGTQTALGAGAGINWLLNRAVRLSLDYDLTIEHGASSAEFTYKPNLTTLSTGNYTRSLLFAGFHFAL